MRLRVSWRWPKDGKARLPSQRQTPKSRCPDKLAISRFLLNIKREDEFLDRIVNQTEFLPDETDRLLLPQRSSFYSNPVSIPEIKGEDPMITLHIGIGTLPVRVKQVADHTRKKNGSKISEETARELKRQRKEVRSQLDNEQRPHGSRILCDEEGQVNSGKDDFLIHSSPFSFSRGRWLVTNLHSLNRH